MKTAYLVELLEDIDRGKIQPLTSVKNIEGVLAEFIHEYDSYDDMIRDLVEWNYIKC
jgi:hypothetical protein